MVDVVLGSYYPGDSVVHRLDARVKLLLVLALLVLVLLAQAVLELVLLAAFITSIVLSARIPLLTVLKAVLPLCFLLLFPLVFNALFTPTGAPLFSWGVLSVTDEGLTRAALFSSRLFLLFVTATTLTLTTSPITLCDATAALLSPFERVGLPVGEIAMVAGIALRFIPNLVEDYGVIRKAQLARGARFARGGPIARVKSVPSVLVPLFATALRQAEDLAQAMESRCYHGAERTHYHELKIARRDLFAAGATAIIGAALVMLKVLL
ncbi:MAG: energy-coupling factor transporter transmembrane protein EcfT [Coriobacteriales bacterium]|jgi:energy-coupling factor transport system permease protein|nr:energy-coupling factor transporter transmembrane protein EcfT [Coriobacteriales bacterium]